MMPHESKWVHITATYDEAVSTGKLYINGKLAAEQTDVGKGFAVNVPIYIGSMGTSFPFRGLADEIRMFNYILTDEEVANTWNKPLTKDNMTGVMFYYNADGDGYNKLIDKSGNGRHGKYVNEISITQLMNRASVIANCEGCFDGSELSFCIPNEENTGYCGDGEMLGNKQCDGGTGCTDNCSCIEGYIPNGYAGCLPVRDSCDFGTAVTECQGALDPACDCNCFNIKGIMCMYKHGCYTDFVSENFYRTWSSCTSVCSDNMDVCYVSGKNQKQQQQQQHYHNHCAVQK